MKLNFTRCFTSFSRDIQIFQLYRNSCFWLLNFDPCIPVCVHYLGVGIPTMNWKHMKSPVRTKCLLAEESFSNNIECLSRQQMYILKPINTWILVSPLCERHKSAQKLPSKENNLHNLRLTISAQAKMPFPSKAQKCEPSISVLIDRGHRFCAPLHCLQTNNSSRWSIPFTDPNPFSID